MMMMIVIFISNYLIPSFVCVCFCLFFIVDVQKNTKTKKTKKKTLILIEMVLTVPTVVG